jgi:hypothetical protein
MAHASTYRIYLTSSGSKRRIAKIVHGPYHPEEEAL